MQYYGLGRFFISFRMTISVIPHFCHPESHLCHPERSEGSAAEKQYTSRCFTSLNMTMFFSSFHSEWQCSVIVSLPFLSSWAKRRSSWNAVLWFGQILYFIQNDIFLFHFDQHNNVFFFISFRMTMLRHPELLYVILSEAKDLLKSVLIHIR